MSEQQPLEFPCHFPIKAMGLAEHDVHLILLDIVQRHAPQADGAGLNQRPSSNGKYISATIVIEAQSKQQLDAIYMELSAHEKIIMAL